MDSIECHYRTYNRKIIITNQKLVSFDYYITIFETSHSCHVYILLIKLVLFRCLPHVALNQLLFYNACERNLLW